MQTSECKTVEVESFFNFDLSNSVKPSIIVSKYQEGVQEKFVAHLFEMDKPTEYVMIRISLAEVHGRLPEGFVNFRRIMNEAPVILKFWA
jgi:hypothetical protein